MEQTVRVKQLHDDGTATVLCIRESACSGDCHKCAGCGAAQEALLLRAENPIGAAVGDLVVVQSSTAPVLRGAAVVYILPLALFFLGYFLGQTLLQAGALTGGAFFLLSVALILLYERRVSQKEKLTYTITGYKK